MRRLVLVFPLFLLLFGWVGCSSDSSSDNPKDTLDATTSDVQQTDSVDDTVSDSADTGELDLEGGDDADTGSLDVPDDITSMYPTSLPFVLDRKQVGEPLTETEIDEFTNTMVSFYQDTGYFDWLWWTSHGLDGAYDSSMHSYKLFWQDTQAVREGDTIRFDHYGGADNLALRTTKLMNNLGAGYLATGSMLFGRLLEQYCYGIVALSLGMDWAGEDPPVKYLQARAIFTHNHSYTMEGNRHVTVDYDPVKVYKADWNAHTFENPENPNYGTIWLRSMRSKDDVPHMLRSVPVLRRVAAEGADESIREAAALAVEYLDGFAKDIVDSGYQIRTRDEEGNAIVPLEDTGLPKDLASFVMFEGVIPNAECAAKVSSALVAYHEPLENDCGLNLPNLYEEIATQGHYFNYAIVRTFHLSAIANALINRQDKMARELLVGCIERSDMALHDEDERAAHHEWDAELASWLLAAAAAGMPLTHEEARLVRMQYAASAKYYRNFPYWDPWTAEMEDGPFDYKPERTGVDPDDPEAGSVTHVRVPEMAHIFEYCWSPFRNPKGAALIDCDAFLDASNWAL